MKKCCVVLFMILFVSMCVPCFAEGAESAQILFRGIPWGISLPEVRAQLPDVSWQTPSANSAYNVMYTLSGKRSSYFDGKVQCYDSTYSLKDFKVAGYPVDDIGVFFALTPDESGFLPKDINHTKFYKAYYHIEPKDLQAVSTDLVEKLSSIYGEVAEHTTSGSSIVENYYIWYGANNTAVALESKKYSGGSTDIYIWYATLDGDQYLQDALDALIAEEAANAAGDISGL